MRYLPSTLLMALAHRGPSFGLADDLRSALRQAIRVNVQENTMSVPIEVLARQVLQQPASDRVPMRTCYLLRNRL
jgi:hypothetical protein